MAFTTVLSYQMMIEEKLYSAMINAEQRSSFYIACGYAEGLARFLELESIPARPVGQKNTADVNEAYLHYYFLLLHAINEKETKIIKDVRVRYGKGSKDIPKAASE